MPIIHKVGDLLSDADVNVICHQANIFTTFGSGIAKSIREQYPEAYEADCETEKGDKKKLGTYTKAKVEGGKIVVNCYSQTGMGASDRNTSYNDILVIFTDLEQKAKAWNAANPQKEMKLGVPYKYGAGLAGGKWRIINAIFEEIFKNSPVELHIVRFPTEPEVQF